MCICDQGQKAVLPVPTTAVLAREKHCTLSRTVDTTSFDYGHTSDSTMTTSSRPVARVIINRVHRRERTTSVARIVTAMVGPRMPQLMAMGSSTTCMAARGFVDDMIMEGSANRSATVLRM